MHTGRRAMLGLLLSLPFVLAAGRNGGAASDDAAAFGRRLLAAVPPHGEKVLGRPEAPVTMIEYASATCPHCAEFHGNVLPEIKARYIDTGKVRLIFREFPLDQRALAVFMLARCVPDEKYFPTLDMLFRRQKLWNAPGAKTRTELLRITAMAGLTEADADSCLKRQDLARDIFETGKRANAEFGVKGTPAFFINGAFVDGHESVDAVSRAIDAALAGQN